VKFGGVVAKVCLFQSMAGIAKPPRATRAQQLRPWQMGVSRQSADKICGMIGCGCRFSSGCHVHPFCLSGRRWYPRVVVFMARGGVRRDATSRNTFREAGEALQFYGCPRIRERAQNPSRGPTLWMKHRPHADRRSTSPEPRHGRQARERRYRCVVRHRET